MKNNKVKTFFTFVGIAIFTYIGLYLVALIGYLFD